MLASARLARTSFMVCRGRHPPGAPRGELSAQRTEGGCFNNKISGIPPPKGPPLRGGSREAGGGENLRNNPLPLHLVPHLHNTTIYTLPKSAIKTLSKNPKKVLDKGHTSCYNNQAVSRGGQPLKLVTTACMAILKPKGFKKYRKKFLTKELL